MKIQINNEWMDPEQISQTNSEEHSMVLSFKLRSGLYATTLLNEMSNGGCSQDSFVSF
jgi:tRNA(Glu) U13 pseudouridine synthase TruD